MNCVNLTGRLVRKPELRMTESGVGVCAFTIAVERGYKNKDGEYEADFLDCTSFKGIAESLNKYCDKGDLIGVSGRLQKRSYDTQDNVRRYITEIIADRIDYLAQANRVEEVPEGKSSIKSDEVVLSDDDLPF